MGKPAQSRALFRLSAAVVSIHLDDVALAVHLVAVVIATVSRRARLADYPASISIVRAGRFPTVARRSALIASIAPKRGDRFVIPAGGIVRSVSREIAVPVFLASQKGAPRGLSRAAVVERAARTRRVGRVLRHQQRVTSGGAGDLDFGKRREPEIEQRIGNRTPGIAGFLYLDNRHSMNGDLLVNLGGWPG